MKKCLKFFELDRNLKVKLSVYCGCDYVENLKGIGYGTLINYTDSEEQLDKFITEVLE